MATHPFRTATGLALATAFLVGCATQSPSQQGARLRKAAGVTSILITCTKDLWNDTRPYDLNKVPVSAAAGDRGARGLETIRLNGPQLVSYLKELDRVAHPGWGDEENTKAEAQRMYDALAPVVDGIKPATSGEDAPPEVLVDDTIASQAP